MKSILLFILISLFFLCQCSFIGTRHKDVSEVTIVYKLPYLVTADSMDLNIDSGAIYKFNKYRVYESYGIQDSFLNGNLFYHGFKSNYTAFDTNAQFGYYAASLKDTLQKIRIDSVLSLRPNGKWLSGLLKVAFFANDIKVSPTELVKKYYFKGPGLDSTYFYFNSSLKDMPYSLYPELDSMYNSKLFKVEVIMKKDTTFNAVEFNKYRKASLEISQDKEIKNKEEIIRFINKVSLEYKNDHK